MAPSQVRPGAGTLLLQGKRHIQDADLNPALTLKVLQGEVLPAPASRAPDRRPERPAVAALDANRGGEQTWLSPAPAQTLLPPLAGPLNPGAAGWPSEAYGQPARVPGPPAPGAGAGGGAAVAARKPGRSPSPPANQAQVLPAAACYMRRLDPVLARQRGVRRLPVAAPSGAAAVSASPRPPVPLLPVKPQALPSVRNPREEALWSLSALVDAFGNGVDCAELLPNYYRTAPTHGLVLADWLASRRENPFLWSRLHHRVRWRSHWKHLSLLGFAEESTPGPRQAGRLLIYVKGWMAEFDDQDNAVYRSRWLRTGSNRMNFARFFRQVANCLMMARYLDEILKPPRPDLAAQMGAAFGRIDRALEELRIDAVAIT
eukprot:TRINITY_DN26805_c0_g1_i1.p1 TRINITY_DN26805_c0_g1~~TRINITY_DN26805_c0_g1_i1.p1  ORF type:complete len:374 (-),score=63.55 TRINITY_DN26805_c0_g1_i1:137-1258(-)